MGRKSQQAVNEVKFADLMAKKITDVESLAKEYHEICREMVNKQIGMITKPTQPYLEWKDLTEDQRDGRRFIAKQFLSKYQLFKL